MFILPAPRELHIQEGYFHFNGGTSIVLNAGCGSDDLNSAVLLQNEIKRCIGIKLAIVKSFQKDDTNCIYLKKRDLEKETYELIITGRGIEIYGGESVGLFYGIQTLRQIIRINGAKIPCVSIQDAPYFAFRGYYHDVTRGKVPTLDTLKELADRLAFYKINQLQLYIEHTFAFKNQSEVWTGADPLTAEEILVFDEYCKNWHIELIPSLSTFGHLYQALSSNSFHHLCELEGSAEEPYSWISRMLHHTLDVSNPQSFAFVQNMLDEFIPLFSSDKFNICCDETFDLGTGKNKDLAEKVGKSRLYVDFLNKIIQHVKQYGKKVMFWGDIIVMHPELLNEIPRDVICLNWDYSADVTGKNIRIVSGAGLQQYVCPGVAGWNRLMNSIDISFTNIKKMVQYGRKYNAVGVLNTDWGDFGHINLFASSIPGMIYGGVLSWNPDDMEDFSVMCEKISRMEFGDRSGRLVGLLRELSFKQIVTWLDIVRWKDEKYHNIPMPLAFKENLMNHDGGDAISRYERAIEIADELLELAVSIPQERKLDLEEFYISARGIALLNALYIVIKKYDFKQDVVSLVHSPEELAELLEYWLVDYSKVWRVRNKESELFRIRDAFVEICSFLRKI